MIVKVRALRNRSQATQTRGSLSKTHERKIVSVSLASLLAGNCAGFDCERKRVGASRCRQRAKGGAGRPEPLDVPPGDSQGKWRQRGLPGGRNQEWRCQTVAAEQR